MAESSKNMVYIVAIIAIVILVGIVVWFLQRESSDTLRIDIGGTDGVPALVTADLNSTPDFPGPGVG
jgi:hypothetical protein